MQDYIIYLFLFFVILVLLEAFNIFSTVTFICNLFIRNSHTSRDGKEQEHSADIKDLDPDKIYKIIRPFIQNEITMALAYMSYKHEITDDNSDATSESMLGDLLKNRRFPDFLPFYFWGAIDDLLAKKGLEPGGDALGYITIVMGLFYGWDEAPEIINETLKKLSPSCSDSAKYNCIRVAGSEHLDTYITVAISLAGNTKIDLKSGNLCGENSLSEYLCEEQEEYLLSFITNNN